MAADDVGIVGVSHRVEFHQGIQMHEIEQFPAAQAIGGNGLLAVDFFFLVSDRTGANQFQAGLGEHIRVEAQVLLVLQRQESRRRQVPQAGMHGGPVVHEPGYVASDGPVRFAQRGFAHFEQRLLLVDQVIHVAQVDEAVAEGDGHGRIHLGNDRPGGLHRFLGYVHGDAEAHVPVFIRRRDLDQGRVDLQSPIVEQTGNIGNENGNILGAAFPDRLPGPPAGHKEGLDPETMAQTGGGIPGVANGEDMQYFHIVKVFRLLDQAFH